MVTAKSLYKQICQELRIAASRSQWALGVAIESWSQVDAEITKCAAYSIRLQLFSDNEDGTQATHKALADDPRFYLKNDQIRTYMLQATYGQGRVIGRLGQ